MEEIRRPRGGRARPSRRNWLLRALVLGVGPWLGASRAASAEAYPATAAGMREAHEAELAVYHRYVAFGRRARQEGYLGVAYLFKAFASAELIHANNFGRVFAQLGGEVLPIQRLPVEARSTRDNLIAAAETEAASVDEYYPRLLERIRPEGHADAMEVVRWAWSTEKLHREDIRQIRRWSPSFFERVARTIDEKTGSYYVCQVCGNTVHQVPAGRCPICGSASRRFRLIDPPA